MSCTLVPGAGTDECSWPPDCITYYYTCIDYACTQIVGDPSLSTCGPPGPLPACPLPPGECTISVSPNRTIVPPPRTASLSWNCWNVQAGSCSVDQGVGSVPEASSVSVSPPASTSYTVSCIGLDGNPNSASAELKVYNFTGGVLKEIKY
jgi:hypothetical protein